MSKWISVEDKLPEESGWYLCYTGKENCSVLPFSKIHKQFNAFDGLDEEEVRENIIVVSHWMPLPEFPKVR